MAKKLLTEDDGSNMFQSKKVADVVIDIQSEDVFHDNKRRRMDVMLFDGGAICTHSTSKHGDRQYISEFPKLAICKEKELADAIRDYNDLEVSDEITVLHSFKTYGKLVEV